MFYSSGSGLYSNLAEYDLEDPQDIFDLDFFRENPKPFFKLAKALFPKAVKVSTVDVSRKNWSILR